MSGADLMPHWDCEKCGAFNGEAKEPRAQCRACGAEKPLPAPLDVVGVSMARMVAGHCAIAMVRALGTPSIDGGLGHALARLAMLGRACALVDALLGRGAGKHAGLAISEPYATRWIMAVRYGSVMKGKMLCVDDACALSGGFAHAGACVPCDCGLRHARLECPALVWSTKETSSP